MKIALLFLALTGGLTSVGQTVLNLDETPDGNRLIDSLNVFYTPALTSDSTSGIMSERATEYKLEWADWKLGLSEYLNEQGFFWHGPNKVTVYLYSNPMGKIDFFLYQFKMGSMDEESYFNFGPLAEKYIQENSLPLSERASQPFSECGPAIFMDAN